MKRVKAFKAPKCRGHNRKGEPCGNHAIQGGTVCRMHGGAAPQVKRAAEERLRDLIDPDRWRDEVAALAYSRLPDIVDADGNVKHVSDWPDNVQRAVSSVEVVKRNLTGGDGEQDVILKVRFYDKNKALEMAGKHLNLFREEYHHTGGIEIRWKRQDEDE